jgi:hypothetical protein
MTKAPAISLNSFDARSASETPFEFEFIHPNGEASGLFLSVLGGQSKQVTDEVNRLMNERRRKEHARDINARTGGRKVDDFTTVESDIAFGQRVAAVRIVGWRGIPEQFTPELALELCQSNADIATQVNAMSADVGNFMKSSSPT